jgi:hypothetical protein
MMASNDKKPGDDSRSGDRSAKKKVGDAKPLVEEVEEALIDQDIPVETGVKPGASKRQQ